MGSNTISRRNLLGSASLAVAGGLLTQKVFSQDASPATGQTILALGAHYDDCIFGIPGILLKAVGKGHRVVMVSILGDITPEWPRASEWLGRLMAIRDNMPYDPKAVPASVRNKETLARYRGAACGVPYAEAVRSFYEIPREIF